MSNQDNITLKERHWEEHMLRKHVGNLRKLSNYLKLVNLQLKIMITMLTLSKNQIGLSALLHCMLLSRIISTYFVVYKPISKSTPVRHICNPCNFNAEHMSPFNIAHIKPLNLMNWLLWGLQPFLLFQVRYSFEEEEWLRKNTKCDCCY